MTEQKPLAIMVMVSDGTGITAMALEVFSENRARGIDHMVREQLRDRQGPAPAPALVDPPPRPLPPATGTLTQREIAQARGYTGDACDRCQSFSMRRSGTCMTCDACGTTTGCS